MLISEVALGRCCDFTTTDTTLTQPPDGYDSTHGVGKKHDNSSEFEVRAGGVVWDNVLLVTWFGVTTYE